MTSTVTAYGLLGMIPGVFTFDTLRLLQIFIFVAERRSAGAAGGDL